MDLFGDSAPIKMISFSHNYPKLSQSIVSEIPDVLEQMEIALPGSGQIFPSIRSTRYNINRGFTIGDIGVVSVKGDRDFLAKCITHRDIIIADIPLAFLRYDAGHPKVFEINSKQDFVDGLNLLTKKSCGHPGNNKISTKKRIFFFKRIAKLVKRKKEVQEK